MNTKTMLRWLVIGGFAGVGIFGLVDGIIHLAQQQYANWAFRWLFLVPLTVVISGAFLAISYFTFTRQYHRLCMLIAVIAAVAVFGFIIFIPEWLDMTDRAERGASSALSVFSSLLSIVALIAAWYGARWVYRRVHTLLLRYVQHCSYEAA